jgi:hypothetical protein
MNLHWQSLKRFSNHGWTRRTIILQEHRLWKELNEGQLKNSGYWFVRNLVVTFHKQPWVKTKHPTICSR